MSFEFKDGRYFIGTWFVAGGSWDWMCSVFTDDVDSNKWEIRYRFRYYEDNKTFDSKDKKSWYGFVGESTEEKIFTTTDGLAHLIAEVRGGKLDYIDMRSDVAKECIDKLTKAPWVDSKHMSVDEAKAAGYVQ